MATNSDVPMPHREDELIPTRASLISRLKNWQDGKSWEEFFNTYWKLIYGVSRKTGLSDAESQDVVQETLAVVARQMPNFNYDPKVGSFKSWLMHTTRWKIIDQFRKRGPLVHPEPPPGQTETGTDPMNAFPEQGPGIQQQVWDEEWEKNVVDAAVKKVRQRADPQKYQIFDLYVNKEWTPEKLSTVFQISIDQVYLIKHRITDMIKAEVKRLEDEML
jgi:RNA polymerase sigma factor (sigma-70 family)